MTRFRFYPIIVTSADVIDRSRFGAIAGLDFGDLTWGRWGSGALLAGCPPTATRLCRNIVAGRTMKYQSYHADPAKPEAHIADQDEALFLRMITATTKPSGSLVEYLTGRKCERSTAWDIASRTLTPFEQEIGYPTFYLEDLTSSPHPKLRELSDSGNTQDMAHPFFIADELTAHEKIEALVGLEAEIAQYAAVNNWHRRFEQMPAIVI